MITEDSISDQPEKKPHTEEVSPENNSDETTETNTENSTDLSPADIAPAKVADENSDELTAENKTSENTTSAPEEDSSEPEIPSEDDQPEVLQEKPEHQADVDTQKSVGIPPAEKVLSEIDPEKADHGEPEAAQTEDSEMDESSNLSLPEVLNEMEKLINQENAGSHFRTFNQLKERANHLISDETED